MTETFSPSQFMLILPPKGLSFSEDQAAALAAALLNIVPPTNAEQWVNRAREILKVTPVLAPFGQLARLNPNERRRQDFADALPMITEFVQRLATARPELTMKGFQLYGSVGDLPSSVTSSRGVFHPAVAYAVHPADPNHFIPVADFHSYLLHDKRAEFLRLAGALGAKEVRQRQRENASRSVEVNAKIDVPSELAVNVRSELSASRSEASYFSLSASFGKNGKEPRLPDELRWYHQEPLWKAMADTRLNSNAMTFEVTFRYQQDFQVNAFLVAGIEGLGLSIGGSFATMTDVEQACTVEFHSA